MSPHEGPTDQELGRALNQGAAHEEGLRARAAAMEALARACAVDEGPLLAELREAGFAVASVWDFTTLGGATGAAITILAAHLDRPHHPRIWEGIVRALSTKEARSQALALLRRLYAAETDSRRRWVLANAIAAMARFNEVEELEDIGSYRSLFRQTSRPPHPDPAP